MAEETVEEALGAPACHDVDGKPAKPYVVELTATDRSLLQVKFQEEGVVLVSYDCKKLTILDDCTAPGDYGYIGIDPEVDAVRLKTAEDIGVNIGGGVLLASKVEAELKQGKSLDLAIMTVGKRSTAVSGLAKGDLTGGECSQATHYVRRADIGGFAMEMGASKEANAAVEIFGQGAAGSSKAEKSVRRSSGSQADCKQAGSKDETPPKGCGGVLQLSLLPVGADGEAKTATDLDARRCPDGFVFADHRCTRASEQIKHHLCVPGDETDCTKQCQAGNDGSCGRLAAIAIEANPGKSGGLDDTLDPRMREACDAGEGDACYYVGYKAEVVAVKDSSKQMEAVELMEKAVLGGNPLAGYALRSLLGPLGKRHGFQQDVPRLARSLKRGCDAGNGAACSQVGFLLNDPSLGDEVAAVLGKDKQTVYANRACAMGSAPGCFLLGILSLGKNEVCYAFNPNRHYCVEGKQDLAAAEKYFKAACKHGDKMGCVFETEREYVDACVGGNVQRCRMLQGRVKAAAMDMMLAEEKAQKEKQKAREKK